jgi:uncharacterized protein YndB with AHSA1/START domain
MSAPATDIGFGKAEVTIVRMIAAPRDLVFSMWTDPVHLAQWWGPQGFINPVCEVDARPGGKFRIVMRAPNGNEHPMIGEYREIVAGERLVFASVATDNDGNPLLEGQTTVTFADDGGQTRLTVHSTAVGLAAVAPQMLAGMEAGWTQTVERLVAHAER